MNAAAGPPRGISLGALFPDARLPAELRARRISGLAADSRLVRPGFLFAAIPGTKADGLAYAAAAVRAGAVALLATARPADLPPHIGFVEAADPRAALARAAARFYPRQPAVLAAVTGTNGKTSVASFLRQIWTALGHPAASMGTVGLVSPLGVEPGSLTTPDPIALHETLDRLAGAGVTHLALEASSHGLVQHRLDGLRLAAAGFTNLTRDHLDYHGSFEAYRAAKLILFETLLPSGGMAVVCADGAEADAFLALIRRRGLPCLTVGRAGIDLRLVEAEPEGFGQRLVVDARGRRFPIRLALPGAFQADNVLVAAGLAIATGADTEAVMATLGDLEGAPGRLEKVAETNGALVVVDYAHTPDALTNVLATLRPYAKGRLIAVFGAGGDRDAGKRPLMGAAVAAAADLAIVTDDNPRSEDPAAIRRAVLAAAPGAREIGDRAAAIAAAIAELRPGDVLLIAGKGHETGQIVGDRTLPYADHDAVRAVLEGRR
ncbi:MAG TPA: UDP-N-acetylmuramoyl-L-alanyl-D-glutamate--2,6-diaminopimelate ligase [Hyphomicrobiales bacterium]|nr:UDP-N-acetylmuramoyl-L-alanyl-D-glutamate--2,6-diaminopimelate ligase [Hyphomicrobiales bacterium]